MDSTVCDFLDAKAYVPNSSDMFDAIGMITMDNKKEEIPANVPKAVMAATIPSATKKIKTTPCRINFHPANKTDWKKKEKKARIRTNGFGHIHQTQKQYNARIMHMNETYI
jgi:UDP-N-acetylglucosamine enolpyruvyl transferase